MLCYAIHPHCKGLFVDLLHQPLHHRVIKHQRFFISLAIIAGLTTGILKQKAYHLRYAKAFSVPEQNMWLVVSYLLWLEIYPEGSHLREEQKS